MPFTIQVDLSKRLIVARLTGVVEIEDVLAFYQDMEAAVPAGHTFRLYTDHREAADAPFIATDISLFASTAMEVYGRLGIVREAIVAKTSTNLGLAAMYRQFTPRGREIQVFTRADRAVAWLSEEGAPELAAGDCAPA